MQRRGGGTGAVKALFAAAVTSDGRFLAVGGGDRKVGGPRQAAPGAWDGAAGGAGPQRRPRAALHPRSARRSAAAHARPRPAPPPKTAAAPTNLQVHVFDAVAGQHVASYPGHRDVVSGLVFKEGSHTLYSASFDRTVKVWSIDDGAYGARTRRAPLLLSQPLLLILCGAIRIHTRTHTHT